MRILGRNALQKCKLLLLAVVLLHVVQILWVYLHGEKNGTTDSNGAQLSNQQTQIAMENLRKNLQGTHDDTGKAKVVSETHDSPKKKIEKNSSGETFSINGTCTPLVPYRTMWKDTISTFDIPDVANYSLDETGRYYLPRMDNKRPAENLDDQIHVTLIPFSHSDPGYGMTMEGYYQSFTHNVLNLMVDKLTAYRNMTFQWAETVFLERWFQDITPARKEQVKDLIKRGQLEVVLGGWVMPDEALTRFEPVIDQLIEGHQWVVENLDVIPENAWINDPFGYSSTMPYLWKSSGIENMVILRIHQAIKSYLMSKNSMEFMWRPYWERTTGSDILCNLMAYEGYWNSNVCGPKEVVCKQFNFLHLDRFDSVAKAVSSKNIQQLAQTLYEQYSFTASLYKFNHLVIFLGEDNSYNSANAWDDTYRNYDKLIQNINNNPKMPMQIEFGTLKTYFKRVRAAERTMSLKSKSGSFPVLSGDFFPYSDWENAYWTGYFTTRPWLKRYSRELESVLRSADFFSVVAVNLCLMCAKESDVFNSIHSELRTARRELGMFQHHDGITGTSLPYVVQDYETRLTKGYRSAYKALKLALLTIQTNGSVKNPDTLSFSSPRNNPQQWIPYNEYVLSSGKLTLLIANPLARKRTDVISIRLRVKNLFISLSDSPGVTIPYQVIIPSTQVAGQKNQGVFIISFVVTLKPLMTQMVILEETEANTLKTEVLETPIVLQESDISIENSKMKVYFDARNGMMKSIVDKSGKKMKLHTGFMRYKSKTSGAYLFGPEGPAVPIDELNSKPTILITKGSIYSELSLAYNTGFSQTVRLYNIPGERNKGVHIQTIVNLKMNPGLSNSELVWRLKSDVKNGQILFTDQNGFQILGRKTYPKRLIESNFYPVTTTAFIEDDVKRLSVHTAQPHGVASLENGWLELMLDRTMTNDDKRGLGMGVPDRVLTVSDFVIQVEHKKQPGNITEERYNSLSASNIIMNEQLQNPLNTFAVPGKTDAFVHSYDPFLKDINLPCDTEIVGLRNMVTNALKLNGTSLILHRKSLNCAYEQATEQCSNKASKVILNDLNFGLTSNSAKRRTVVETSLSHLHVHRSVKEDENIRPETQRLRSFVLKYL